MFAAGVEFLPESGDVGVGVRFRERKLEYTKNVRVSRSHGCAIMNMRYAGEPFKCAISFEAISDFHGANFKTEEEFTSAVSEMLHQILAAVERQAKNGIPNGQLLVTSEMLDPARR